MTALFTGTCGPVPAGTRITQPYGYDPTYIGNAEHYHYGLDLGVYRADTTTPVEIAVDLAGPWPATGYGNVVLGHYVEGYTTWYLLWAHLLTPLVAVGDVVPAGAIVGVTDNSGFSTGDHLHFARGRNGYWVGAWEDPLPWLLTLTGEADMDESQTRAIAREEAEAALTRRLGTIGKEELSPIAIAARDAGFVSSADTPATDDGVSRGIRRLRRLFQKFTGPGQAGLEPADALTRDLSREETD